jgi:eukaryotic-like serine/threonine-protein kinase
MSDTLMCEDSHLQRPVVVKSLKAGIDKGKLLDELAALASIRSKFVVELFDAIHDGSEIVGFIEEYIEGGDLKPFEQSCGETVVLKLLYGIATGISDVHAHDRVHRDIKPDNIRLDVNGVPKIIDFGLAKLATNAKTTNLFFTPCYSPPETFAQDTSGKFVFTTAVDVYAFGVLAYWLLNNGELPKQLTKIPPDLPCMDFTTFKAKIPLDVQQVLARAVSATALDRPTAFEIKEIIGRRLLFDQHKMLLTYENKPYYLNAMIRQVKLSHSTNEVVLVYDGLVFKVVSVKGFVLRNNKQMTPEEELNGASVIVLGDPNYPKSRVSMTADISYPEVLF